MAPACIKASPKVLSICSVDRPNTLPTPTAAPKYPRSCPSRNLSLALTPAAERALANRAVTSAAAEPQVLDGQVPRWKFLSFPYSSGKDHHSVGYRTVFRDTTLDSRDGRSLRRKTCAPRRSRRWQNSWAGRRRSFCRRRRAPCPASTRHPKMWKIFGGEFLA